MANHVVVTREEWVAARKELLKKEKQLTGLHDELSRERRELPWVKVENEPGPHKNLVGWVRHHDKYGLTGFVDAMSLYRTGTIAYEVRT
jgi:hypothetical protein